MRLLVLNILLGCCLISPKQIDESMIEINVHLSENDTIATESMSFEGLLHIKNISQQKLKLPKYFDLGYYLFDAKGNQLSYRQDAIYEYVQKIKLKKRRIKPNEIIEVVFSEDRLDYEYDLQKDRTYYIQYFLLHEDFSKEIKTDKIKI